MNIVKNIGVLILSIIGVIILAVAFFNPERGINSSENNQQEVEKVVMGFGQNLKNVSLQNTDTLSLEIKNNYQEYLSPQLLSDWMSNPSIALGRDASVEWPENISILSIVEDSDNSYEVQGEIIFVSNEGGGINESPTETSRQSIGLTLEKINDKWQIIQIVTGPINKVGGNWLLSQPDDQGIQFMYPDPLSTKYITASVWPPQVELSSGDFDCEVGEQEGEDGIVKNFETRMIGDREYCVGQSSEGAAGSTYRSYEYSIKEGDYITRVNFTLRSVQCANYDQPEQGACMTEQAGFDVDGLADRIVLSVRSL